MKHILCCLLLLPALVFAELELLDYEERKFGPFLYKTNNILWDNSSSVFLEGRTILSSCATGEISSVIYLNPFGGQFYSYWMFRGNENIGCIIRDENKLTFTFTQGNTGKYIVFDISSEYISNSRLSVNVIDSNGLRLLYQRRGERNILIFEDV